MLKSGDVQRIQQTIATMTKEADAIITSMVELSWYMRGAVTYLDMFQLSSGERDKLKEFVENHMESIKDSRFPIY
jgi:hypothetical protein